MGGSHSPVGGVRRGANIRRCRHCSNRRSRVPEPQQRQQGRQEQRGPPATGAAMCGDRNTRWGRQRGRGFQEGAPACPLSATVLLHKEGCPYLATWRGWRGCAAADGGVCPPLTYAWWSPDTYAWLLTLMHNVRPPSQHAPPAWGQGSSTDRLGTGLHAPRRHLNSSGRASSDTHGAILAGTSRRPVLAT